MFLECQTKKESDKQISKEINEIVQAIIEQDTINVLKGTINSKMFCTTLEKLPIEIPKQHKNEITPPPLPGRKYITDLLNYKVDGKPFFESRDSINIIRQNIDCEKFKIDNKILNKLNSTKIDKEMSKKQNGKHYDFYEMKIPIFSIDRKKAYVELDHRCSSRSGSGRAFFLKKIEDKWTIIRSWETWTN